MSASNKNHSNRNGAAEAAEWFISLQGADVSREQQEAFADWLRRSPVHVEEFLHLTALQGELARLPEFRSLDVEKELASLQLPGEDDNDNVICLNVIEPRSSDAQSAVSHAVQLSGGGALEGRVSSSGRDDRRPRGARFLYAAAAATAATVAIGLWFAGPIRDFLDNEHYTTAIGEQRSLTLADGSQIQLNARSNLSAKVDKTARELQLEDGEALFRVAKDSVHPFRVHTPQATIEAKGTQFNVHVSNGTTVVSLLEGHVLVTLPAARSGRDASAAGETTEAVMLNPGEEISIAGRTSKPPQPHPVDLKVAVAWTEHRLVFEDAPLADVIAEFNRYSRQPFVIEEPVLGDARITASFDSNSTQTFAGALSAAGGLRVIQLPDGAWVIRRR